MSDFKTRVLEWLEQHPQLAERVSNSQGFLIGVDREDGTTGIEYVDGLDEESVDNALTALGFPDNRKRL